MGQKPSHSGGRFNKSKLTLLWILGRPQTTHNPNPEQPIKFQYKTRRKNVTHQEKNKANNLKSCNIHTLNNLNKSNQSNNVNNVKNTNLNDAKCRILKTQNIPHRTKSEPNLIPDRTREKHRQRRKNGRIRSENLMNNDIQQFGYEIQDIDSFLAKATIEKPANIPVVLAFPSVLYQTKIGGYQAEIYLPLGMVVNAVFKNERWLYVQTPHAEEGYVSYAACLPLGIIPPPDEDKNGPCWENSTDLFPKPSGNMTDTEKLSSKSDCDGETRCRTRRSRNAVSACGERSVDRLYLRATATAKIKGKRQTLLVISSNYEGNERNGISVKKGEVVFLLNSHIKDWFWVRNKEGFEGFIPAVVAGHGFL